MAAPAPFRKFCRNRPFSTWNRDISMRFLRRLAVIALLFLVALPQLASAHAQLHETSPIDGAVIETMPEMVTLSFTEEISPLVLRWVAPDGSTADAEGAASGKILSVNPPVGDEQGSYVLSWRIVSGDGHPVGGALTFHLGAVSAGHAGSDTEASAAIGTAVFRFLLSLALVSAVGAAIFAAFVARDAAGPGLRRYGLIAVVSALPFAALFLGFQGLDLTALPVASLLTPQPWLAAADSPVAYAAALSVLAAILAGAVLLRARGTIVLVLLAWGMAAMSYAVSGHVVTAPPRMLSTAAVAIHAVAMIYWTGALVPLLMSLRDQDAVIRLQRFSTIAIGMVLALVISGVVLVAVQSGNPEALFASDYGKVLGVKLVLVTLLLALAALNRFRLTPALVMVEAGAGAGRAMARSIGTEIVLAVMILGLAAMFRLTPPPRAFSDQPAPAHVHIHGQKAMADVTLSSTRVGPVTIAIGFQTGDFTELLPKAVDVAFAPSDGSLEPIRQAAIIGDDGLWHAGPVSLPLAGDWEVTLRVLITDFESALLTGMVEIVR